MLCLLDTNILISAILFPNSVPAKAFIKTMSAPYVAIVSDYTLEEMRSVCKRKFPHKLRDFEEFLSVLSLSVEIVKTPNKEIEKSAVGEQKIRDINDRPIYRAAIVANADIIITGDKDLLEAEISNPKIINATSFLNIVSRIE